MPWFVTLLVVLAVMIVPFVLGGYVARLWRMPDYGWKFGLILFTLCFGLVIVVNGWPPKLGIDLSGGTILVYEIDKTKKQSLDTKEMDALIRAVSLRVNPSGVKEVTIRPYGPDQIQIIIPLLPEATSAGKGESQGEQEAKRIEDLISRAGTLEFRILANHTDDAALIKQAEAENTTIVKDPDGKVLGWWVPVFTKEGFESEPEKQAEAIRLRNLLESQTIKRQVKQGGQEVWEVLVRNDDDNVTGQFLTQAKRDDSSGSPWVAFSFNPEGAALFGDLTSHNLPDPVTGFQRRLGIILDGKLYTAPGLKGAITDHGVIEGTFTVAEVEDLVNVLNAGSLPTALAKAPIQRLISGPTLGADTIRKSTYAMIISSILVPLFMVWYYRFSGGVAIVALSLNMLLLLAIMILVGARFTLTGLAGLALTIGMAVDNNVLLYERLREELERGATLRMAIRNAFHRAGAVIVDTNTTHLIAATVLYVVGSEQVKGFAVTFWLGAAISIFTAVFVARVIFEVAERRHWLTQAKMLKLIGHTSVDFMSWFPLCATFSVLITVAGLLVAWERGKGLFDIDFTGGVSVEALFKQPHDTGDIRQTLKDLPDLAVSDVRIEGEEPGKRFIINTSEQDLNVVQERLQADFPGQLVSNSVEIKDVMPISAAAPAEEKSPAEKAQAPAEEKEKPSAPPSKEQTRNDLPADNVLAMATPVPWLLAQADAEAKPADDGEPAASAEKPADAKKDAKKAEQKKAKKKKAASKKADESQPAATEKIEKTDKPGTGETAQPAEAAAATSEKAAAEKPAEEPKTTEKTPAAGSDQAPKGEAKPAAEPSPPAPLPKGEGRSTVPLPKGEGTSTVPPPKGEGTSTAPRPEGKESRTGAPPQAEKGTAPAVAFVGGTQARLNFALDVNYKTVSAEVSDALRAAGLPESTSYQLSNEQYVTGDAKAYPGWVLKIQLPLEKAQALLDVLKKSVESQPFFPASNQIGGAVAEGTRIQAVYALVSSWLLIILYLWIRFQKVAFGLAAVIALIHDVLVMLGAVAFSYYMVQLPVLSSIAAVLTIDQFKVNLPIIAAFMTIIGYSVNDTIVVFDRIREVRGKDPNLTRQMVNDSTNQTLSRTLLTSFTVLLVVVILYFFGGEALHGFAFALLIGVLTGTYSSIYVAAPVLLWLIHPPKPKSLASLRDQVVGRRQPT